VPWSAGAPSDRRCRSRIEGASGVGDRLAEIGQPSPPARFIRLGELGRLGFAAGRGIAALVWLEQRVALELGLDVLHELDVGELQKTDGLLQLGCHHQLLALSQLQLCRKRHALNPGIPADITFCTFCRS
jgi:hypothetical protein